MDKQIESCALCDDYPCKIVEDYPYKPFIEHAKNDIEARKKLGKEEWIKSTIEKNTCPSCKTLNHWRANKCMSCEEVLPER